jgi:hypothetical protein
MGLDHQLKKGRGVWIELREAELSDLGLQVVLMISASSAKIAKV